MLAKQRGQFLLLLTAMATSLTAWATEPSGMELNMPVGVTPVSREIYGLHMDIIWWCVAIGVVVFGVMFYTMIAHRKSRGAKAANFHESTTLEIIWTAIPFVILILMAIPATKTLINIYDAEDAELDVFITGYQWKWKYEYMGEDVSFFSNLSTPREQIDNRAPKGDHYLLEVDEPLVLPVGRKVRFLITANDVIHSWWVPDLAVKKDGIPGFVNESWAFIEEPGIYRGQCAELCGKDHGFMPIVVDARPQEEFDSWLSAKREEAQAIKALTEQTFEFDEMFARGKERYAISCAACHGQNGEGGVGPAIQGSAIATGPIDAHLDIVVNGSKKNPMMAAYGEQLSEVDLAAVLTYQRNAFGNNMGDMLQPIDVLKFKQGK